MQTLSLADTAQVGGGDLLTAAALAALATWLWANRSALNDIAQGTASTAADLDAECGG